MYFQKRFLGLECWNRRLQRAKSIANMGRGGRYKKCYERKTKVRSGSKVKCFNMSRYYGTKILKDKTTNILSTVLLDKNSSRLVA